ncbi:hypothetical protein ACTFIW_012093 [Dictyostelium discoideum]
MPEPEVMDEASYEVRSILNHDKVKKIYLVKERENATTEAIEPIVSSLLSQRSSKFTTISTKYSKTTKLQIKSKKRKSKNQNTSSDGVYKLKKLDQEENLHPRL